VVLLTFCRFEKLNPSINLPETVKIPLATTLWPHDGPRRASVNSFGFGGANAHVVLEDAASYFARNGLSGRHSTAVRPGTITNGKTNSVCPSTGKLVVLSSYDQEGVKRTTDCLKEYVQTKQHDHEFRLEDLAYTLASKRTSHPWKSFAIASTADDLLQSLDNVPAPVRSSDASSPNIAWVFTGQGAQYAKMGSGLLAYPAYKASLERAAAVMKSLGCTWDLLDELIAEDGDERLRLAEYSQPICTALQVAMVDLLGHWGVQPAAVVVS
jgi:acyl transferase domain-containing protein